MQRYFVRNEQIVNDIIRIVGADYHHIKNVMRMNIGKQVYVCNDNEESYISEIIEINSKEIVLKILEKIDIKVELNTSVTIAMGLTRSAKQEEVVRRVTELGASGFISVKMERSVVKDKGQLDKKLERLVLISKEASEQSHRTRLLKINQTVSFKKFLEISKEFDVVLYAYEESGRNNVSYFKKVIPSFENKKVLILVGPEGGISQKEVEILNSNSFMAIGLGPRILRCETAPLYIMSAISYEMEL